MVTFESLDGFGKFLNGVLLFFVLILDLFESLNLCLQIIIIPEIIFDFEMLFLNIKIIILRF